MAKLNRGGEANSASISRVSPNQKPATLSEPRMLTPSEIESLRQNKRMIAKLVRARLLE